ncbi:MAG: class III extradiol dioxygenase subunit B-like domain-containing protein [Patescibacteria group bacterium]|nr:class III extradiol dioxygenase subunit B-like domain-containing protein [Patescibacteria group bacterium]
MINFAAICPHPALIVPQVGGSQMSILKKTVDGMEELANELKKHKPETIVVISPHGPMRYDKFTVNLEERLKGSFANYGGDSDNYEFKNDIAVARQMFSFLKEKQIPVEIIRETMLDYGTLVPLHYLISKLEQIPNVIPLTFTSLNWSTHEIFGKAIGSILNQQEHNIALIASADLSHRLTEDAPAGFSPYGIKFDHALIDLLKKSELEKIKNLNPDFCDEAGECGLRSIIIALSALTDLKHSFKQYSYEGPIGVGYLVGEWKIS